MRTLVGLFLAVSVESGGDPAAAPSTPSPAPTQGTGGWSLVFADEFLHRYLVDYVRIYQQK